MQTTEANLSENHVHDNHGESNNIFGFWIYIMSDCALFAAIFAVYAVLQNNTFGGLPAKDLFSMPYVMGETMLLLTSSFTCGLAMLAMYRKQLNLTMLWLAVTFALGFCFMVMEINEFVHLIHTGNAWDRSGFLSAFFTLVGTHGLHVSIGLIWLVVLMIQLRKHNINSVTKTKLACFSLFWHFLDIVWIFVFTLVYLNGAI